ncbi:hypothetical protein D3C78_1309300 [compost metagenome]
MTVPDSLIFFRVPLSSSAKAGADSRAMAMALLSKRGAIRMGFFLVLLYAVRRWPIQGERVVGVSDLMASLVQDAGQLFGWRSVLISC